VLLASVAVLFYRSDTRDSPDRLSRACADAGRLYDARLLREARQSVARIQRAKQDAFCATTSDLTPAIQRDERLAGASFARAHTYLHAARNAHGSDARRAERRARNAFAIGLHLDPYDMAARKDLRGLLARLDVPQTKTAANRRCISADRLRRAGLLPEAGMVYGQALRTGRTNECKIPLWWLRDQAGSARMFVSRARAQKEEGNRAAARASYISALIADPSITAARRELTEVPAEDPRDVSRGPKLTHWLADRVVASDTWIGDAAKYVAGIVVGGIVLLLTIGLVMAVLLLLTRIQVFRRLMDGIPFLHRFTRTRMKVGAFLPEENGLSSGSVFAHYVGRPAIASENGDIGDEFSVDACAASDAPNDTSPGPVAILQSVPQLAALAAATLWLRNMAPRREVKIYGQLLQAGPDRFGLRVVVVLRNGTTQGSETFWASDLPGRTFTKDDELAARHALAIYGAAWAHEVANR
jgi:hypothetical protein